MNITEKADESRAACKRPGKFEGAPPYALYFWYIGLEGFADRDNADNSYGFDVTMLDKQLFPELKKRRTVNLRETDQGFVEEI